VCVKSLSLKARNLSNLKELCATYQASGLYTHVYAACGFLEDSKNTAECSLSPRDGRHGSREIFDLSSLTKALVTTPLVLWKCLEAGLDPKKVTIRDVFGDLALDEVGCGSFDQSVANYLRHETGLPAWKNFYAQCHLDMEMSQTQSLNAVLSRLSHAVQVEHLSDKPIEKYSDIGFLILGSLLEKNAGSTLLELWRNQCQHFGMTACDRLGRGEEFDRETVIPTAYCPVRSRLLIGEVHDENAWALGGFTGHSGLFGGGLDVTAFLRELWQSTGGRKVMLANFGEQSSTGDSLMGWRKGQDDSSRAFAEGRGCGHLGFTGTAFWVDPLTKSYSVVLTNRVISGRITPEIKTFRREAFKVLWDIVQSRPFP
jgi:serine-type D-Ala-D-Ala carboxypeptidase